MAFAVLTVYLDEGDGGLKGSPTQVRKSFTAPVKGQGVVHEVGDDEAVEIILAALKGGVVHG